MGRDRNESGRYNDRIEPDSVLEVFEERDDLAEPLTASDIVDRMDIARRTAHNKLNRLVDRDVLSTKKVGARGRVWWIPDTSQQSGHSPPQERPDTVDSNSYEERPDRRENDGQAREIDSAIDEALDGWRPGQGREDTERRRAIGRECLEWLREQSNPVQKSDFVHELYEQTALEGQGEKSWWVRVVRPGLNHAAERGYVDDAGRTYEWVGE